MTPQEATDVIKQEYYEQEYCLVPELAPALEMAIEALEKQIPKEPIENYYMDSDPITGEPYPVGIVSLCPNCKTWLAIEDDCGEKSKHCKECGQAISWE